MRQALGVILLLVVGSVHSATVIWDESVDGDLGDRGSDRLTLSEGEKSIPYTEEYANDRDSFVVTVSEGYRISNTKLVVDHGQGGGNYVR